jgi:hypothetical protein
VSYVLVLEVSNEGHGPPGQIGPVVDPAPTRTAIKFDLPAGGTEADAKAIARGIRRSFKDVFDARVKVVGFQEVGLSRDVELGA